MKKLLLFTTALFLISFINAQKLGTLYSIPDGLPDSIINAIIKDVNNNLWIGTKNGLSKYNGTSFTNYSTANGLPSNNIYSLDSDNSGNIYIGTSSGAAKYDGTTFTPYDSISGIVYSIIVDQQNRVWSSSGNNGIFRFDGTNWEHYTTADGLSHNNIYKLFEDNVGYIYAGGRGTCILNKFNASTWLNFETDTGCLSVNTEYMTGINQDINGDIWVSGMNIIDPYPTRYFYFAKFDGSSFTIYEVTPELSNTYYNTSFYFRNNDIISCTKGSGLGQFDIQNNTTGFYNNANLFYNNTKCLLPDGNDLWVGTDRGLVLITDFDQLEMHPNSEYLDTNNFSVLFHAMGDMFWDLQGSAQVEIPKGSGAMSLFAGGLWFGAYDQLNDFHGAANKYWPNTDFWAGPLADNYDVPFLSKYNRLWKINKSEIDYHIQNYNNGSYQMPDAIKNWPGNGSTANGEAAQLAPYFDNNQNEIYEPQFGDYPLIRGDQAVYFIYNDARLDTHLTSHCEPMGIEIHAMAYAYDNLSESLDNTFFVNFKIINRSANDYHDMYIGQFNDYDLGDAFDDYTGCDSTQNTFFVYNGDDIDGDGNGNTYGLNPPAQGITFLNYPMTSFMYYNNGSCDYCDPTECNEFYNYMQAIWKNGIHLTYGGTGHTGGSECHYIYPVGSGWSEESEGNTPYDKRGIGATGPLVLNSGEYICIDFAYPWARDTAGAYSSLLKLLNTTIGDVQTFYDAQNYSCYLGSKIEETTIKENPVRIFPNPTTGRIIILADELRKVEVINVDGKQVYSGRSNNIDLSQQAKGIYIIKVTTSRGVAVDKVILN